MYQRTLAVIAIVIAMAAVVYVAPIPQAHGEKPVAVSDGPQLFLDDYLVAREANLQRRLQQPARHPANPLIVQDQPWEKRVIEIYGTVLYEPKKNKFRCWYLASENNDGIPDGHGFCVLPTPLAPNPMQRYRGLGGDIIGFSPDGIHWEIEKTRPGAKNDTSSSVVCWKGEYLAFVRNQGRRRGGVMREVGISVSKDFRHWTPKKTVFKTDEKDGYPWTQPYGLAVTAYGDQLIGIVWMIHLDRENRNNMRGSQDMQLIVSRDGRKWNRVADRAVFMGLTAGAWDEGRIFPGTTMFVKDDLVHIYYSGTNTPHGGGWGRPGIGLATLPADRFVALTPDDDTRPGLLQTKPFSFQGKELLVNAEVPKDGLQVELLDAEGDVVPGFGREHCRLLKHDSLRYRVAWGPEAKAKSIGECRRETAALRFHLNRGALYAFQIIK